MLSGSQQSVPMIFFLTDGAVENERQICEVMIKQLKNQGSGICPRVYTFGIGNDFATDLVLLQATLALHEFNCSIDFTTI